MLHKKLMLSMLPEVDFVLFATLLERSERLSQGSPELLKELQTQVAQSRNCVDRANIATQWQLAH